MEVERIMRRSMVKFILLHFVTLGLYDILFYYRLSLDVEAVCEGDGIESPNYLTALVLAIPSFGIYPLYWLYKVSQRMHVNAPRYGLKMMETGRDIVILDIVSLGFISAYELIKNMNRIAQAYNKGGSDDLTYDYS